MAVLTDALVLASGAHSKANTKMSASKVDSETVIRAQAIARDPRWPAALVVMIHAGAPAEKAAEILDAFRTMRTLAELAPDACNAPVRDLAILSTLLADVGIPVYAIGTVGKGMSIEPLKEAQDAMVALGEIMAHPRSVDILDAIMDMPFGIPSALGMQTIFLLSAFGLCPQGQDDHHHELGEPCPDPEHCDCAPCSAAKTAKTAKTASSPSRVVTTAPVQSSIAGAIGRGWDAVMNMARAPFGRRPREVACRTGTCDIR